MMKNVILLLGMGIFLASCETKTENLANLVQNPVSADGSGKTESNAAKMTFEEKVYNFGNIKQGEIVSHSFVFKNTGNADLVITNTKTTCGCTVPDYPKSPIKVGEKAKIEVKFDSAGKSGLVEKEITIVANTVPTETVIKIQVNILAN